MPETDAIAPLLDELVAVQAPSGAEEAMDAFLARRLAGRGALRADAAGNRILRIAGRGAAPAVAITAHKDEIAAVVKRVEEDGRLVVRGLGDAHPWVWGEGPVELLGSVATIPGVLSFGARHVSKASPQRRHVTEGAGLGWEDARVDAKLDAAALAAAGVGPGTPCVLAAQRRAPTRLGAGGAWYAAPNLDDRVAVAALALLADRLAEAPPAGDVELVFTTREEVGCHGAQYYARSAGIDDLVALEVAPVAAEYGIVCGPDPVLVAGDARAVLTPSLGEELRAAAARAGVPLQAALLDRYGSDASTVLAGGLVARGACLAVATDNTHGREIVHLTAVAATIEVLAAWVDAPRPAFAG